MTFDTGCYRHVGCHPALWKSLNPHPARRLDAMRVAALERAGLGGFQSSSSPKAGCYGHGVHNGRVLGVSILIQPEGWMLSMPEWNLKVVHDVSILIQPEGWMLLR